MGEIFFILLYIGVFCVCVEYSVWVVLVVGFVLVVDVLLLVEEGVVVLGEV